ncbi:hypothetical protein CR513_56927, partial [Mucuna pruriens]
MKSCKKNKPRTYLKSTLLNRHPRDKIGLGFDKKKEIKRDKSNVHYLNYRKFGHMSYDCRERPKGPSKHYRTNKKGPNRI